MDHLLHARWLLILPALALLGCGLVADRPVPVQGTVTLDGGPLANGEIYFCTPGLAPEIVPIRAGRFEGMVKPGNRRVEIYAYRIVQPSPGGGNPAPAAEGQELGPGKANILPARFNAQSPVIATVTPEGPNQFIYEVESR